MNICFRLYRSIGLSLMLTVLSFFLCFSSTTFANEIDLHKNRFNKDWQIASNAELDSLRGGFTLPNGMVINFSLEKVIYRNGVEIFTSFFELPKNIQLIQNGNLNVAKDLSSSILNSAIQNNLDNQVIRTVNTINIDISNLKNISLDISNTEAFKNIFLQQ